MRKKLPAMSPLLLLAGCAADPDAAIAGRWELTSKLDMLETEGIPRHYEPRLRRDLLTSDRTNNCFDGAAGGTRLQAVRDGLTEGIAPSERGATCSFAEDDLVEGGLIRITATCGTRTAPGTMVMRISGRYTTETMDADLEAKADVLNPRTGQPAVIRTTGTMTGRRTGACG